MAGRLTWSCLWLLAQSLAHFQLANCRHAASPEMVLSAAPSSTYTAARTSLACSAPQQTGPRVYMKQSSFADHSSVGAGARAKREAVRRGGRGRGRRRDRREDPATSSQARALDGSSRFEPLDNESSGAAELKEQCKRRRGRKWFRQKRASSAESSSSISSVSRSNIGKPASKQQQLATGYHQTTTLAGGARMRQKEENNEDLIELLAQFYAHVVELQDKVNIYLLKVNRGRTNKTTINYNDQQRESQLRRNMGADEDSLLRWLREKQSNFESLANTKFELLQEVPNRSIIVCPDGPKILILPNVSDIVRCYTHDQWIERLWLDLKLQPIHYPIIVLNLLVFLIGATGNVFVCLSVYRNHQLRNVTNYFIVNLALADLLVILICLPATVIWDLSLTWFFGTIACKLVMFLQDVSISVSVLTLTSISLDRYQAICHPLKFKSNLRQAKRVIIVIWFVSLLVMLPDLFYLSAHQSQELAEAGLETVLYSDCDYNLDRNASRCFQFVKTILLYLLPFLLMFCTHFKILRTLHVASTRAKLSTELNHLAAPSQASSDNNDASWSQFHSFVGPNGQARKRSFWFADHQWKARLALARSQQTVLSNKPPDCNGPTRPVWERSSKQFVVTMHNRTQLESRRKAAKMLTAIVVLFGLCYLPVHLINSLRQFIDDIPQTDVTSSICMLAHCVCYLNSAINPIIYNYMNSVFRAEFRNFLSCCLGPNGGVAARSRSGSMVDLHHERLKSLNINNNNNGRQQAATEPAQGHNQTRQQKGVEGGARRGSSFSEAPSQAAMDSSWPPVARSLVSVSVSRASQTHLDQAQLSSV